MLLQVQVGMLKVFPELMSTETVRSSGFFLKKKATFNAAIKSTCIRRHLQNSGSLPKILNGAGFVTRARLQPGQ
jgi:hypothetical protein